MSLLFIVPGVVTNTHPLMEYAPPVTEIGAGALIPVIDTVSEVSKVLSGISVCGVKLNASGVVSAARVVTSKSADIPSMVSVAVVVVEKFADDVCSTITESPFTTVPGSEVKAPPLMEYVPPMTEIGSDGFVLPLTVIALESTVVLSATSV